MATEVTAMDVKMLVATLPADANLSEWCRRLGISRPTAYKWRVRYAAEGVAGLEDRSRAPRRPAGRVDGAVEDAVVTARKELADEGLDCGPASIHDRLIEQGLVPPSEATIWRIGVRRGQITPQPKKRPRRSYRRFTRERPNELWQGDDTHYELVSGQEVRIINLLDDHSRVNVDSLAAVVCRSERIWECFSRAAQRYGVPAEFLNDNGRAWISASGLSPVVFQAHLVRLGVRHFHSAFYHPQTCGKVERFHQTQRRWLDAQPQAHTIAELQALLDQFRYIYNHHRPHRGAGRRQPADVWTAQTPASPPAPLPEGPARVLTTHVYGDGTIWIDAGYRVNLGVTWADHHVTIIRRGLDATVIDATTGEIIRELTIDPSRPYQPSGRSRGGPHQPRRAV
jgi:transposase InsO family protein